MPAPLGYVHDIADDRILEGLARPKKRRGDRAGGHADPEPEGHQAGLLPPVVDRPLHMLAMSGRDIPVAFRGFLTESIPGAHFAVLPGASHFPFVEDRDQFVRAVRTMLSTALPPHVTATRCASKPGSTSRYAGSHAWRADSAAPLPNQTDEQRHGLHEVVGEVEVGSGERESATQQPASG